MRATKSTYSCIMFPKSLFFICHLSQRTGPLPNSLFEPEMIVIFESMHYFISHNQLVASPNSLLLLHPCPNHAFIILPHTRCCLQFLLTHSVPWVITLKRNSGGETPTIVSGDFQMDNYANLSSGFQGMFNFPGYTELKFFVQQPARDIGPESGHKRMIPFLERGALV